eukprot:scaffold585839_cov33-Prasinocladus_malaysianus.AAC.1
MHKPDGREVAPPELLQHGVPAVLILFTDIDWMITTCTIRRDKNAQSHCTNPPAGLLRGSAQRVNETRHRQSFQHRAISTNKENAKRKEVNERGWQGHLSGIRLSPHPRCLKSPPTPLNRCLRYGMPCSSEQ